MKGYIQQYMEIDKKETNKNKRHKLHFMIIQN